MLPSENPPENLRTASDRLTEVTPVLWTMMGIAVVAAFVIAAMVFTPIGQ